MFGVGSYATIWKVENKGNYDVCQLSTQKKNKETGAYETDFAEQGVRFVGKAHGFHPQSLCKTPKLLGANFLGLAVLVRR